MAELTIAQVEDGPAFAKLAAVFLERPDDRLSGTSATGAETGLTYPRPHHVDGIESDFEMPDTNGLEFLDKVRQHALAILFILFTAGDSIELENTAKRTGATRLMQKQFTPVQVETLARGIDEYVSATTDSRPSN